MSRTSTGRGRGRKRGRGRGRGRERRRGRGGRGGGSSSLPPPTITLPLIIEEFFIVIYEDPLAKKVRTCSHNMMHMINYVHALKKPLISNDWRSISLQALPKKFANYLDGQEPAKVYL
jgi:hypothetical protein